MKTGKDVNFDCGKCCGIVSCDECIAELYQVEKEKLKKEKKMSTKATGNKFFYVAQDSPRVVLSYRHGTIESAYEEARRLAKKENKPFIVLGTICRIVPEVTIKAVENIATNVLMRD